MSTSVVGSTLTNGVASLTPTYTFNDSNQLTTISVLATTTAGSISDITITGPSGSSTGTNPKILTLSPPSVGPFTITYVVSYSDESSPYSVTTKVAGYDLEADFIFVDTRTSECPTLIVFPNPLTNPIKLNKKAIFIKDVSWNASIYPITIQATGGARIEDKSNFILNKNGECLSLFTDLSEYYISSIYPSNNCALMETVDSTNSYNVPYLKAQAITDIVNVFNTDNTPPFNPDGSINTNPSTTQRQTNQNLVLLPPPAVSPRPSEGFMCMVIYGGGLTGKRHTYPLAFYSGDNYENIDGTYSSYNLQNAPCIATGNSAIQVLSTTAPNIVTLGSLVGVSALTPVSFSTSLNGISSATQYYVSASYNENINGNDIPLSLTDDGLTPLTDLVTGPTITSASMTFPLLATHGDVSLVLDSRLFPGQIQLSITGSGNIYVGMNIKFDTAIYGLNTSTLYNISEVVDLTLNNYQVSLTIGLGGVAPVIWNSNNSSSSVAVADKTWYSVGDSVPLTVVGTKASLPITSIINDTTTSAIDSYIISYKPAISYITGQIIQFSVSSDDGIIAATKYYVHSSSTAGSLVICDSSNNLINPINQISYISTITTDTLVILKNKSDINSIGSTVSFVGTGNFDDTLYTTSNINKSDGTFNIKLSDDSYPLGLSVLNPGMYTSYVAIIDSTSTQYIILGAPFNFSIDYNGFYATNLGFFGYNVSDAYDINNPTIVPLKLNDDDPPEHSFLTSLKNVLFKNTRISFDTKVGGVIASNYYYSLNNTSGASFQVSSTIDGSQLQLNRTITSGSANYFEDATIISAEGNANTFVLSTNTSLLGNIPVAFVDYNGGLDNVNQPYQIYSSNNNTNLFQIADPTGVLYQTSDAMPKNLMYYRTSKTLISEFNTTLNTFILGSSLSMKHGSRIVFTSNIAQQDPTRLSYVLGGGVFPQQFGTTRCTLIDSTNFNNNDNIIVSEGGLLVFTNNTWYGIDTTKVYRIYSYDSSDAFTIADSFGNQITDINSDNAIGDQYFYYYDPTSLIPVQKFDSNTNTLSSNLPVEWYNTNTTATVNLRNEYAISNIVGDGSNLTLTFTGSPTISTGDSVVISKTNTAFDGTYFATNTSGYITVPSLRYSGSVGLTCTSGNPVITFASDTHTILVGDIIQLTSFGGLTGKYYVKTKVSNTITLSLTPTAISSIPTATVSTPATYTYNDFVSGTLVTSGFITPTSQAITGISGGGSTVTITLDSVYGFFNNTQILIQNTYTAYDGTYVGTVSGSTLTYSSSRVSSTLNIESDGTANILFTNDSGNIQVGDIITLVATFGGLPIGKYYVTDVNGDVGTLTISTTANGTNLIPTTTSSVTTTVNYNVYTSGGTVTSGIPIVFSNPFGVSDSRQVYYPKSDDGANFSVSLLPNGSVTNLNTFQITVPDSNLTSLSGIYGTSTSGSFYYYESDLLTVSAYNNGTQTFTLANNFTLVPGTPITAIQGIADSDNVFEIYYIYSYSPATKEFTIVNRNGSLQGDASTSVSGTFLYYGNTSSDISATAYSSGIVTVTVGSTSGYSVGNAVSIHGATPSGFNGIYTILSVLSSTTFTVKTSLPTFASTVGIAGLLNKDLLNVEGSFTDYGNSFTTSMFVPCKIGAQVTFNSSIAGLPVGSTYYVSDFKTKQYPDSYVTDGELTVDKNGLATINGFSGSASSFVLGNYAQFQLINGTNSSLIQGSILLISEGDGSTYFKVQTTLPPGTILSPLYIFAYVTTNTVFQISTTLGGATLPLNITSLTSNTGSTTLKFPISIIDTIGTYATISQDAMIAKSLDGDSTKSTGALFISDGTTWYTAGWYDPTNWVWDRTLPTDSADYFNMPNTYSQFALTISPNVNSFVNMPTLSQNPSLYSNVGIRSMPFFIIAKNTAVTRSKVGFSTYIPGNSNMFNDNATVRIYWVGSKITKRPCIWFVSEVRPGETRVRYYPLIGFSP
jgi:hypothetical protein